jgi:hypothetical protein
MYFYKSVFLNLLACEAFIFPNYETKVTKFLRLQNFVAILCHFVT